MKVDDKGYKLYTRTEIRKLLKDEGLQSQDDYSWIVALGTVTLMIESPDGSEAGIAFQPARDVRVVDTEDYDTGYYFERGQYPVIVLNTLSTPLVYEVISELHPIKDAEIYLWLRHPYDSQESLDMFAEWYRRDVFKDKLEPFDGTLGEADLPPEITYGD